MKKSRGFTLFELLITIAIVAVLASLAIPSFQALFEKNRLRGAAEAVYEQLQYARAESVKKSRPIVVDFWIDNADATSWSLGITDDEECWNDPACATWGCDAEDTLADDSPCTIDYDNDRDTDDPVLVQLSSADFRDITMIAPSFGGLTGPGACATTQATEACFEPVQGFARSTDGNNNPIQLNSPNPNYILQVEVDAVGRIKVCVPPGATKFLGYEDC